MPLGTMADAELFVTRTFADKRQSVLRSVKGRQTGALFMRGA